MHKFITIKKLILTPKEIEEIIVEKFNLPHGTNFYFRIENDYTGCSYSDPPNVGLKQIEISYELKDSK